MSVLHINQIASKIVPMFEEKIDISDIGSNDPQKEEKIKTRCLAAYAVYCSIDCTIEEAAASVVDGGDDNGIDAIYYSPLYKRMIIVQSKWSKDGTGEPDSGSVAKFCKGVRDLFNLTLDRFNAKIQNKRSIIEQGVSAYDIKYTLIFIDTHTAINLATHAAQHLDDLLGEMNNVGDENAEKLVSFERMNQSKVHSSLAQSAGSEPINIEMGLMQWGVLSEPFSAYYGMVAGTEVLAWWEKYEMRLFEKNIRQVLGKTDVNDEIKKTLTDAPDHFWYFNNGVTIIADKIEKSMMGGGARELGTFQLTNMAIVNGAQTISSIGKFGLLDENKTTLNQVKVQVRIIQLQGAPSEFDKEVTRTNNRQNRIENRDFVSQDPEQSRIKTELMIDGIDYNVMRSENFIRSDKSFDLIEATAALACSSGKTSLAVQAKSGIGKFYENVERGIYKEIFNPSVSGYYVYNVVKIGRQIDKILAEEIKSLPRRSGRDYGILVHGNRIIFLLAVKSLTLNNTINTKEVDIEEAVLKSIVLERIMKMKEFLDLKYPDSIMGTLFKNIAKCNEMTSYITTH